MSQPKKLPNSIRYFRARFRHLTKPLFWGPIGVASLVLLFAWELSVHPEWLTLEEDDNPLSNSNSLTENLSAEEASIMADIDNSSVLNGELETYKKLQLNPLVIPTDNLLKELQGEAKNQSASQKTTAKLEEYFTSHQPETTGSGEAKINNFPSPNLTNLPQNLPDQNQTENANLLTSPLLPSVKLLDSRNRAQKDEKTVNPLQTAMDEYLGSQNKSSLSSSQKFQGDNSNLYQTQTSIGNVTSSPIPNSPILTPTQSEEQNNFNPPLPAINITPQKPYYTDLSGSANQSNNQTNLSGSNYLPQRQPTTQTMPSLVPVAPNGLVNNQNIVNGVNNWGVPNYYGNQGFPQNQQQQQYGYGVNPNQVNQGGQPTPSYNSFSRSNSFYNRSYGNSWNNPFNNNQNR